MKQVVLNIPDKKYHTFINHLKSKFSDIEIKEKKTKKEVAEDFSTLDATLLSEKSLSEDWMSDDDNRWDEVL